MYSKDYLVRMELNGMENFNPIVLAFLGTGLAAVSTAIGAASVFFFKNEVKLSLHKLFLGFAAGLMIAASVFALIIPAFEFAEELGMNEWLWVSLGFMLGGLFLLGVDLALPKLYQKLKKGDEALEPSFRRAIMLVSAISLHNIPEGLAVGLILGSAAKSGSPYALAGAAALALAMILHNLPEGAAVSLPLRKEGYSTWKSFGFGALSGVVEPIAGVLGVILVGHIEGLMPILLGFAAGAMIYVVAQELIPESQSKKHPYAGTIGVMFGFLLMMLIEVILG